MSAQQRRPGQQPSYYDILNLSPSSIEDAHDKGGEPSSNQLIKRAYRRALLSHHPDKQQAHCHQDLKPTPERAEIDSKSKYTIDQISQAYAILSSPTQRSAYDRQLKLLQLNNNQNDQAFTQEVFQTGIENIDLDDLEFEEAQQGSSPETKWYRPCRCGNPRGYLFSESDLEEASDLGELMVGCADCSLWLRVHFAVVEDGDDAEENGNGKAGTHQDG